MSSLNSKIRLEVTFMASYQGDDFDVPYETTVEETIVLVMPQLEEKYVVLPKVLEGVTTQVIEKHRGKMAEYREAKAVQERAAEERAKMFTFVSSDKTTVSIQEPSKES